LASTNRLGAAVVIVGLTLMAAGCGAKTINQLRADPAKYRNQSVTVQGTVDQSASVAGRGAYRIVDGDQDLWVVTSSGAPRKGARVSVTGRLQDGYDLGALAGVLKLPGAISSGLVLIESSHKARD
jgi:hypothetical protein